MTEFEDMLRQIPGMDSLIASGVVRIDTALTMEDLEFLPDLDTLDTPALEELLDRLEGLLDDLEDDEPVEDSEAHSEWEESLDEVSDFIEEVQSRLDGDEEK